MIAHLAAALVLSCGQPPDTPPANPLYLPPNLYLVRTTTVKVWQEPKAAYETGRLRVTRVLAGPERLTGKEFECRVGLGPRLGTRFGPSDWDGYIDYLEEGEGLWWVYEGSEDRALHPELRWKVNEAYRLYHFPYQKEAKSPWQGMLWSEPFATPEEARKQHAARAKQHWKEGEDWAAAAVAVYRAKSDNERRVLLEKLAAAPGSSSSAWAMALLARGPKEPAAKFLTGLAGDGKLYPDAQVTLDRLLCKLDRERWIKSPARRRMFTRWLDCGADEPKPGIAIWCARLGEAQNAGELDAGAFVELLTPVLARDTFPVGSLYHLGHLLILVRFADGDRDRGFKFLCTVARTAKPPALRGEAARGLQQFRPLPAEQRKDIQDLWDHEKEPVVLKALGVLLRDRRPK